MYPILFVKKKNRMFLKKIKYMAIEEITLIIKHNERYFEYFDRRT